MSEESIPTEAFGLLRSRVHGLATERAFAGVFEVLDGDPEDRLVDYALEYVSRWPGDARVLRDPWSRRVVLESPSPIHSLVRRLVCERVGVRPNRLLRLVTSEYLVDLESLEFHQSGLASGSLTMLSHFDALPSLRHLTLGLLTNPSGRGVDAFLTSPMLSRLKTLRLAFGQSIEPELFERLLTSEYMLGLEVFRPGAFSLGVHNVLVLAEADFVHSLVELDLLGHGVGDAGASMLARMDHLSGLERLVLGRNGIGPDGIGALLASPHLDGLTWLDLRENGLGDDGAREFAKAAPSRALRALDLRHNGLTDEGARALARSPCLSGLATLELDGNLIGPAGAQALASSPFLAERLRARWRARFVP